MKSPSKRDCPPTEHNPRILKLLLYKETIFSTSVQLSVKLGRHPFQAIDMTQKCLSEVQKVGHAMPDVHIKKPAQCV